MTELFFGVVPKRRPADAAGVKSFGDLTTAGHLAYLPICGRCTTTGEREQYGDEWKVVGDVIVHTTEGERFAQGDLIERYW